MWLSESPICTKGRCVLGYHGDLLNTTGSLERFLVSGPIVSQLINDFEGSDKVIDMDTLNDHSESKALQKRFSEDRDKLIEEFVQTGNPFVGYKDIISLKSKIVSPCSSDIYKVVEVGNASLKNFLKEVFIDNKRSVFDPRRQPSRILPKY